MPQRITRYTEIHTAWVDKKIGLFCPEQQEHTVCVSA